MGYFSHTSYRLNRLVSFKFFGKHFRFVTMCNNLHKCVWFFKFHVWHRIYLPRDTNKWKIHVFAKSVLFLTGTYVHNTLQRNSPPPKKKIKLCTNLTSLIVISLCIFSVEIYVCTSSKWQFFNHHTNCMYKCMHACILKLPAWSSHFGPEKRSIQAHQIVTSFEPQLPPFLQ